jgi:hypothetical protein
MSFNYPVAPTEEQRRNYKIFFDSLENVLPCRHCRENLSKNMTATDYGEHVFKDRATLSKWVYELHEHVNTMLNKKSNLTYENVEQLYENFRARCGLVNKKEDLNLTEKGCTQPIVGIKSKCVLKIVPLEAPDTSLSVDPRCYCKRITKKRSIR